MQTAIERFKCAFGLNVESPTNPVADPTSDSTYAQERANRKSTQRDAAATERSAKENCAGYSPTRHAALVVAIPSRSDGKNLGWPDGSLKDKSLERPQVLRSLRKFSDITVKDKKNRTPDHDREPAWPMNALEPDLVGAPGRLGRRYSRSTCPQRCTSRPSSANAAALIRQARWACFSFGAYTTWMWFALCLAII